MKRIVMLIAILLAVATLAYGRTPNPEHKTVRAGWLMPPEDNHDSAHAYDVRFYRIDMNLPMTSGAMQAHEQIVVTSRRPGLDSVVLYMSSLTCDSVRIAGAPRRSPRRRAVCSSTWTGPMTRANRWRLTSTITGPGARTASTGITAPRPGIMCCATPRPSRRIRATGFRALTSRGTRPSRAAPSNVTVPETLSVAANGLLDSVTSKHFGPYQDLLVARALSGFHLPDDLWRLEVGELQTVVSLQPDRVELYLELRLARGLAGRGGGIRPQR